MTAPTKATLRHTVGLMLPEAVKIRIRRILNSELNITFQRYRRIFNVTSALRLMIVKQGSQLIRVYSRELGQEITLRRNTSDLEVAMQILENRDYAINVDFEPRLIVDAGANIGISSLFFAKRFPSATIHAIEPDPENFDLLRANCRGVPNIVPHQAALWPRRTALSVKDAKAEKWMFSFRESPGNGLTEAITMSDVIQLAQPGVVDILKLDIEGGEKELFSNGASKWLPLVKIIIIELHDRYVPGCSSAFYSCIGTRKFSQELSGENVIVRFSEAEAV